MFEFLYPLFLFLIGSIMLCFGSDYLVDNSSLLAKRNNISPIIIGVTVIAFGTSLPELVVSLNAALNDLPNLIIGNIVGSNISNICLVLGLVLFFFNFKIFDVKNSKINLYSLFSVTIIFSFLISTNNKLSILSSSLLLVLFSLYLFVIFRNSNLDEKNKAFKDVSLKQIISLIILGLLLVVFGSEIFIKGAISLASLIGLENSVVGLTIVALGTSMPELVVSINAAFKKEYDFIFGNVIGSNIINILLVGGLVSLFGELSYNSSQYYDSIAILCFSTSLLLVLFINRLILSKILGSVFIIIYFIFLYINFL